MIEAIHETIIRDIVDIVQDVADHDELKIYDNLRHGGSFTSITSKAKNLIMTFPVIISSYVSYDTAVLISKAIEQKAAVLLSMLFRSVNISDMDVNDVEDFIHKFHTNMNTGRLTIDDFERGLFRFAAESSKLHGEPEYDAIALEERAHIMDSLKSLNCYFEEDISDYSVDDFKFVRNPYNEDTLISVHEAPQYDGDSVTGAKNYADYLKGMQSAFSNPILPSDVKKANELAPTMLYVNFYTSDDTSIPKSAVVGVKAKLYLVDSEDIMNRLTVKHVDKHHFLNLIKLSTGEISFFKDFLFAIDRAKIDAMSQSKRGSSSSIWKLLERRALKSKFRRSLAMTNDATCITTIVITKDEVEYLKRESYLDVSNSRIISPIMDAYNLMSFVIVDDSLEIANFLFDDGERKFETLTYSALEREQKDNTKKIVNLMAKMR